MTTRRYCRCGALLAGDDTSRLCGPCRTAPRRTAAPEVPAEFWRTDVMAAALRSGDLGRVLRAYRCHPDHGRRLSQALVAGWLHMSQPAVCRIENGRRRVTVDEIANVARALGMPVTLPWGFDHRAGEDVNPLSRRSLLGAGAGAAFGLNATTASPAAASEIDPELASHWMTLLRVLGRHDRMAGPHEVLAAAGHEVGLIAGHRRVARGELQAQLLGVEAHWAWFMSWLSHDAGDWRRRDAWADHALQLARAAGDPDMVAWVVLWQSQWAAMANDTAIAIALADAGRATPGASDTLRAVCTLREAHGHALAGDRAACERSLADAHTGFERAAPSADGPWVNLGRLDLGSPPGVLAYEARCWLELRPARAIDMFEEALRLEPPECVRGRGILHVRIARACAAAGEPDRAAAEGMTALAIARSTRSDITLRELKLLDHALAAGDAPATADFREAFAAL